ncbi:MAG: aminomethyl-transferring glycine dehydrogenase subunit GcvPA [Myxococcota bacterium]
MTESRRYIPHTAEEVAGMLEVIGIESIDDLFRSIDPKLRLDRPLELPPALSEQELTAELSAMAARNASSADHDWLLGAGTYAHYSPSVIDAMVSRGEFLTAYTPYQAEMSQGTLQAIFEWQTMMASLTGMDVANASMYDGASATAEAALMAMRVTRRHRVVYSGGLHPHYRAVMHTYLDGLEAEVVEVPVGADGRGGDLASALDSATACVVIQQPNFFGCIDDLQAIVAAAREAGALVVVSVNEALSLGLLTSPGEQGADLVCGEAQSFGVPMGFGGPHVGFLAARHKHVRQLPGRLAGQTEDEDGRRGFVLTLSTREQHIRRERATSNICTNQGLCLLMATIYLSLMGPHGLRRLAEINLAKAEYAKQWVRATPGLALAYDGTPTFNEFVVRVPDSGGAALERARAAGAVGGLDLEAFAPELAPAVLVCTTELTSRAAIDRTLAALAGGEASS